MKDSYLDDSDSLSEEIDEVISEVPSWTIRWGITVMLLVILCFLFLSYLVQYPDIISSRITITTENPPVAVVSNSAGKIHFDVENGEQVTEGQALGFIENAAIKGDVDMLVNQLIQMKEQLPRSFTADSVKLNDNLQVGELQQSYTDLLESIQTLGITEKMTVESGLLMSLYDRIDHYNGLIDNLNEQRSFLSKQLEVSRKKFEKERKLFIEGVISESDYDLAQSELLGDERVYKSFEAQILTNEMLISELKGQINRINSENLKGVHVIRNSIRSNYRKLDALLSSWENRYVIVAPVDGTVAILRFMEDKQFINQDTEVITIVPNPSRIYGQMLVPVSGSGKIHPGQKINIKLDNFPHVEFGIVRGIVLEVSPIPKDNLYTVYVFLPNGLSTSFSEELPFKQQLTGTAEIITNSQSILERIFNKLFSLLDNG